jgi:hypothetical protein
MRKYLLWWNESAGSYYNAISEQSPIITKLNKESIRFEVNVALNMEVVLGFYILTALAWKNTVSWNEMPCCLFADTSDERTASILTVDPEDGGSTLHRNVDDLY